MESLVNRYRKDILSASRLSESQEKHELSRSKESLKKSNYRNLDHQEDSHMHHTNNQTTDVKLPQTQSSHPPLANSHSQNHSHINTGNKERKQKSKSKAVTCEQTKSQQKLSRKKQTPKKYTKPHTVTVQALNENYSETIFEILTQQKNIHLINKDSTKSRIKILLEEYIEQRVKLAQRQAIASEYSEDNLLIHSNAILNPSGSSMKSLNQKAIEQKVPLMPSSSATALHGHASNSKSSYSFSSQLEKKYLETEKERQYLKGKLESISKKYEQLSGDLEKYQKMQRLVNNTIQVENQSRKQIMRLRKEIEVAEIRFQQQQKMFRKEVYEVHQMMEKLRVVLPEAGGF